MKRAASFCQLPTTDVGQISSVGRLAAGRLPVALDQGQRLDVLPRPMSSARHAPRPQRRRKASQE